MLAFYRGLCIQPYSNTLISWYSFIFQCRDFSPHGHFAPWKDILPHRCFAPWAFRPMDVSPHRRFAPRTMLIATPRVFDVCLLWLHLKNDHCIQPGRQGHSQDFFSTEAKEISARSRQTVFTHFKCSIVAYPVGVCGSSISAT